MSTSYESSTIPSNAGFTLLDSPIYSFDMYNAATLFLKNIGGGSFASKNNGVQGADNWTETTSPQSSVIEWWDGCPEHFNTIEFEPLLGQSAIINFDDDVLIEFALSGATGQLRIVGCKGPYAHQPFEISSGDSISDRVTAFGQEFTSIPASGGLYRIEKNGAKVTVTHNGIRTETIHLSDKNATWNFNTIRLWSSAVPRDNRARIMNLMVVIG